MNYKEFKESFLEDLKTGLEERGYSNVSITTQQTEKLNESYESISITPDGSNVGVNTNLENFFKAVAEDGQDYDSVVARAVDLAANGIEQAPVFDVKALTDYEQMKDKLIMEVVGTEGNAELLSKVPHVEMEDLSVVYRFVMESNGDERAFMPREITPKEANKVGYETAMRFTKGNHAFIVATHVDRAHIHNHVIFNSTNLACDRKFRDFFFIAIALQKLSDIICLEHGLSVIKPRKPSQREKRAEYPRKKVHRDDICDAIDKALLQKPESFEELLHLLEQQGYEIKKGKYPSLKGKDQKRFIRFRSLGSGYTADDLEKIISGDLQPDVKQPEQRKQRYQNRKSRDFDLLIDIQEKIKQGKGGGYTRWAKVYNIKQLSQSLLFLQEHGIRDYQTLSDMASGASSKFNELSKSIKEAEKRLGEIAVLRTHIINYSKTREVYVAYRKSGYSKKYYEAHREEITLHKAAKDAFSSLPDRKIPKLKDLNAEYVEVLSKKKKAYSEYRQAKKEMQDYLIAKQNIDAILHEDDKSVQQEKNKYEQNQDR